MHQKYPNTKRILLRQTPGKEVDERIQGKTEKIITTIKLPVWVVVSPLRLMMEEKRKVC